MNKITIENACLKLKVLSYGGIIQSLFFKNKNGKFTNLVINKKKLSDYKKDKWYLGSIIGRYAGRLSSSYQINSVKYFINNDNGIQLHGSPNGWNSRIWSIKKNKGGNKVTLDYTCQNGSSGHPGEVKAKVTYKLLQNSLIINYKAISDKPTPVNITNHSYFNLSDGGEIKDHKLFVNSNKYLELDKKLLPTGKLLKVKNTKFDFSKLANIGNNYLDDCFVVNPKNKINAKLFSSKTGISMEVKTDQPGIVIFTPRSFNGICFETQKFSNSPNIKSFPNTILFPNEEYTHQTTFTFKSINHSE